MRPRISLDAPEGARAHYSRPVMLSLWAFGACAVGIIPAFTMFFAVRGHPLTTSLSEIGNREGMKAAYLVWTVLLGAFFLVGVYVLAALSQATHTRLARGLAITSAVALLVTALVPFAPDEMPFLATIHRGLSQGTAAFLALTFLALVIGFRPAYPRLFRKSGVLLIVVVLSSGIPFLFFGAAWICTAPGLIGGALFLFMALWWLTQEPTFSTHR